MTAWRNRILVGAAAAFLAFTAQQGRATDYYWNNPAGGSFATSGNWTPSGPPVSSSDKALFTNRTAYTVAVSSPFTNGTLGLLGGEVTFSSPGSNYTFGTLQITNAGGKTNALIISGATTVTLSSAAQSFLNNPTKPGTYKLVVQNGAKLQTGSANALYLGPNGWSAGCTSMLVVAGAGSALHSGNAVQLNSDALTALYVTNGASIKCTSMNLNKQDGNVAYVHRALLTIGDGSTESLVTLTAATDHNGFGGTPGDKVLLKSGTVRSNTTETILLPNGRLTTSTSLTLYPGATLTLAGGVLEFTGSGNNCLKCAGVIRGSGTLNLAAATSASLLGYKHSTDASVTNFGSISPGTPGSPIGTLVISNAPANAYLAVSTNCSLNFDLGGLAETEYDRILATNVTVYLGAYASPYVNQGGAIITVALTNGLNPPTDSTFDVLVAKNIMDTDLSRVTFSLPAQPANWIWTPSIVTNTLAPGVTNEILRLTVKAPPRGTQVTFK